MSKIKTAEEILNQNVSFRDQVKKEFVVIAMKQYAEQFIDLTEKESYFYNGVKIVDYEDIIEIKKLIK